MTTTLATLAEECRAWHNDICIVHDTQLARLVGVHEDERDIYYRVRGLRPRGEWLATAVGWIVSLRGIYPEDRYKNMDDVFSLNGALTGVNGRRSSLKSGLQGEKMMTNQNSKPFGSIKTTWQLRTYDVWGNPTDGYEVNDSFDAGEIELHIPQTKYNLGTPQEFIGAYPSNRQIKLAFGVTCRISLDGDDLQIYVNRERDGYPIGEMYCTSHESLGPVRKLKAAEASAHEKQ